MICERAGPGIAVVGMTIVPHFLRTVQVRTCCAGELLIALLFPLERSPVWMLTISGDPGPVTAHKEASVLLRIDRRSDEAEQKQSEAWVDKIPAIIPFIFPKPHLLPSAWPSLGWGESPPSAGRLVSLVRRRRHSPCPLGPGSLSESEDEKDGVCSLSFVFRRAPPLSQGETLKG